MGSLPAHASNTAGQARRGTPNESDQCKWKPLYGQLFLPQPAAGQVFFIPEQALNPLHLMSQWQDWLQ